MKFILFLLFLTLCFSVKGQNDIQQDTTLAGQYFRAAQYLPLLDTAAFELLIKADSIFAKHQQQKEQVKAKYYLAYRYLLTDYPIMGKAVVDEAMKMTYSSNLDLNPSELKYAYLSYVKYYQQVDYQKCEAYADTLRQFIKKPSQEYFQISFWLYYPYTYGHEADKLSALLQENEAVLNEDISGVYQRYQIYYLIGKMALARKKGNYEPGILYGKQALLKNEKEKLLSTNEIANVMVEISISFQTMGKYDKAIEWLKEAIANNGLEKENPDNGAYLVNLAVIYSKKNDVKKAIEIGKEAAELMKNDTARYKKALTILHSNISNGYIKLNELDSAKVHLQIAKKLSNEFFLNFQYSKVLYQEKEYEKALKEIQTGIIKVSTKFSNTNYLSNPDDYELYRDDYWIGILLTTKSRYLQKLGADNSKEILDVAISTAETAIKVFNRSQKGNLGFEQSKLSQDRNVNYAKSVISDAYCSMYKMDNSSQTLENLFLACEQKKATQLLKAIAPNPLPVELSQKEEELKNAIFIVNQKIRYASSDSIDFFQNKLFGLNQEVNQFLNQLSLKGFKQNDYFYNIDYASISEIQNLVDDSTAFINYSINESNILTTVITKDDFEMIVFSKDSLYHENLKQLRKLVENPLLIQKKKREQFIQANHQLYQYLIQPIEKRLKGINKLMIVPEDELFYLPFETLLASDDYKSFEELDFLIKNFDINYHYSATAYKQLKAKQNNTNLALVAFAPVFEGEDREEETIRSVDFLVDSLYAGVRDNRLIPLPNTVSEVNNIEAILGKNDKNKILLGKEATKDNLINALNSNQYQFIHIATHGFVNHEEPKFSALSCYESSDENGDVLFANEIQQLDINADLVVLSSCESGIGQLFSGEGLIALNRSFIYAGAKNVLFSLWKVNDKYSSELMIDFYKEIKTGKSYTAALRAAKLKMLANPTTASPRYWAPFVLMGE